MAASFALPAGRHYGWPRYVIGSVAGIIVPPLLTIGLLFLAEALRRGGPRFPPCHCGTCVGRRWPSFTERDLGDYTWASADGESMVRCRCGRTCVVRDAGDRFLERTPDGTVRPYMVHRAYRGWVPDAREPDDGG